jgi:carboxyl-terminal processing protease
MLDPDKRIAYVRITAFSRDTAEELRKVLTELQKEKIRGLVLDLRFNPGGLLASAVEVADLFVSEGRIVSTAGRSAREKSWDAHKEGTFEGFPMAVLVNHYSASASEIVAACLQDHKRAKIVGERTWGKASVQNVIELEYSSGHAARSALKLTTAGYRRPNGKNIDRPPDAKETDEWGVRPDTGYELKLDDEEMFALVTDRRARDILLPKPAPSKPEATSGAPRRPGSAPTSGQPTPQAADPSAAKRTPFVDRQLQLALSSLTGELARAK